MKAKPSSHPGEVVLELNRRDDRLLAAADSGARALKIKQILVPIDFSDCAKKALQYAIPLAKEHEAAITLIYVVLTPVGDLRVNYGSLEAEMRGNGEKELAKLATEEGRGQVRIKTVVCVGPPAREIMALAQQLPADLIVISTHGYTGLKHVFLGSVAEEVVRRAPCPVLVVREQEHDLINA